MEHILLPIFAVLIPIALIAYWCLGLDLDSKAEKEAKQREQSRTQYFIDNFGCTEEELIYQIENSPNIDKLAKIIMEQNPFPWRVFVEYDHLHMDDHHLGSDEPFRKMNTTTVKFKDLGINPLPRVSYFDSRRKVAEALAKKLVANYDQTIWYDHDNYGCPYLVKKSPPKTKPYIDFKGW